jgi:hypothetical protein
MRFVILNRTVYTATIVLTMEQHPVPQNVTTFQFRLIGDMTLKQFWYLAGGAVLAYICYKLPLPFFFTWPLTLVCALGGIGFAFVPVEDRPMDVWVMSFFRSVYNPTQYIWEKTAQQTEPKPVEIARSAPVVPATSPLAQVAPQQTITAQQSTPKVAPVIITAPQASHAALPQKFIAPTPTPQPMPKIQPVGASFHPQSPQPAAQPPVPKIQVPTPPQTPGNATQVPKPPKSHGFNPFGWLLGLFASKPKPTAPKPVSHAAAQSYPDVFANTPTPSITGSRLVLEQQSAAAQPAKPPVPNLQATQVDNEAQKKAHALEDKLTNLQKELQTKTITEARILELQKQLTEVLGERQRMEHEITELRQRVSQPQNTINQVPMRSATTEVQPAMRQAPTVKIVTPDSAIRAGLPRLTTFPNVVTGIIKDHENNMLPGVLVTVRDKTDIPLRALKTNKLGQFAASTPLPNGTYVIEVEDPRKLYTFDRAQISLNGAVLPPIEIIAKSKRQVDREKLAKEIFGNQQI